MSGKTLLRSFAGGEITPELAGRIDLVAFQTGLSLCRNFTTLPHGPAARRPGFEFVNECKDSTRAVRIIPFSFSSTQTVVLEFGHQYVRFHINGGTLLENTVTISYIVGNTVNTIAAHGYATGDWVYVGNRYHKVTVVNSDTFTTTDLFNATSNATGTTAARVYTLASGYPDTALFDLHFTQSADVITITHPSYPTRELARLGATNWTFTDVSFAAPSVVPTGVTATATVAVAANLTTQKYCVTAVQPDGVTESLASTQATASNNLSLAGNYNTITWSAVSGVTRYNVYKLRGGVYGYIGRAVSPTLSIVDDNVLADTSRSPPENIIGLNSGAGDYPGAVAYHEQRRWLAGTNLKPQVVWATRTGTESNLTSSIPSQDADGMEFRAANSQYNQIRHLIPLGDLMALTAGGEFRIYAEGAPAITPTSVTIKGQGGMGASNVQPVVTAGSILYVQAQGSRVRELGYGGEAANYGYRSIDVSMMAPHRFNGYTLKQLAFVRAPDPTLWAVRDDGVLLGLTYLPDQKVYGWHAHDTDGAFESVAVVAEGNEDVLYAVILRTVNGRSVRYVERLHTRVFVNAADAFYVDSGLTYSGTPVNSVYGLWHLEGKTVQILADGAVESTKVVTNGAVTIGTPASKIHMGLPYVSDLRTLPLSIESQMAAGQGTAKNITKIHVRVSQSSLVKAGPDFARLRAYPARAVSDPYGSPPALRDGELTLGIDPQWSQDGAVCARQDEPLPLTVLSMVLEFQTGG